VNTAPVFEIDLSAQVPSSLAAHSALALTGGAVEEVALMGMRPPLGVYNVSIGRICGKVRRLSERLESLFRLSDPFGQTGEFLDAMETVVDYMELAVYAAAEHVDDVKTIVSAYLPDESHRKRNIHFRKLESAVKGDKSFLASIANSIKHAHSRFRLCAVQMRHGDRDMTLYGYFLEGTTNGALGPVGQFHRGQDVFSITALVWEILGFVMSVSRSLSQFVQSIADIQEGPHNVINEHLSRAVIAAARLPRYSFEEPHFHHKSTFAVRWREAALASPIDSGLYGSLHSPFGRSPSIELLQIRTIAAGDGASSLYRVPQVRQVSLNYWGAGTPQSA
jgi:hypothetical protein